jgi:hypothetical protein
VKRAVTLSFLLIAIAICCSHRLVAQSCTRHVEAQGGFSICIPDGWTAQTRDNEKYHMLFAPATENFAPNINFKDQQTTATLSDYVAASVQLILLSKEKLGADSVERLGQSDFATDSGMQGIRTVFQTVYKGFLVRTIQYFFDYGHGRKLIVTATGLDKNREMFDRVFDRAARSFRVETQP